MALSATWQPLSQILFRQLVDVVVFLQCTLTIKKVLWYLEAQEGREKWGVLGNEVFFLKARDFIAVVEVPLSAFQNKPVSVF